MLDFPNLDQHMARRLSVKAMNDTLGPEGLVPSLLVFGVLPRFPACSTKFPNQVDRMRALAMARAEMETISFEIKLQRALLAKLPPAADFELKVGDKVLVHRENSAISQGPFPVVELDEKQVFILDERGKTKQFNIAQVKPYYENPEEAHLNHFATMLHGFVTEDDTVSTPVHLSEMTPGLSAYQNVDSPPPAFVNVSENITASEPRAKSAQAMEAKRKEIAGLISRDTWKIICERDLSSDANILGGRFANREHVLTLKDIGTGKEFYKARYVVQGHRDKEKAYLVHDSTTLQQQTLLGVRNSFYL